MEGLAGPGTECVWDATRAGLPRVSSLERVDGGCRLTICSRARLGAWPIYGRARDPPRSPRTRRGAARRRIAGRATNPTRRTIAPRRSSGDLTTRNPLCQPMAHHGSSPRNRPGPLRPQRARPPLRRRERPRHRSPEPGRTRAHEALSAGGFSSRTRAAPLAKGAWRSPVPSRPTPAAVGGRTRTAAPGRFAIREARRALGNADPSLVIFRGSHGPPPSRASSTSRLVAGSVCEAPAPRISSSLAGWRAPTLVIRRPGGGLRGLGRCREAWRRGHTVAIIGRARAGLSRAPRLLVHPARSRRAVARAQTCSPRCTRRLEPPRRLRARARSWLTHPRVRRRAPAAAR